MKTTDHFFELKYPITLHWIEEDEDCYWFASHPDFEHSYCCATGNTEGEAITALNNVRKDVLRYYIDGGINIPTPSEVEQ